jgi:hypothetical protein
MARRRPEIIALRCIRTDVVFFRATLRDPQTTPRRQRTVYRTKMRWLIEHLSKVNKIPTKTLILNAWNHYWAGVSMVV